MISEKEKNICLQEACEIWFVGFILFFWMTAWVFQAIWIAVCISIYISKRNRIIDERVKKHPKLIEEFKLQDQKYVRQFITHDPDATEYQKIYTELVEKGYITDKNSVFPQQMEPWLSQKLASDPQFKENYYACIKYYGNPYVRPDSLMKLKAKADKKEYKKKLKEERGY